MRAKVLAGLSFVAFLFFACTDSSRNKDDGPSSSASVGGSASASSSSVGGAGGSPTTSSSSGTGAGGPGICGSLLTTCGVPDSVLEVCAAVDECLSQNCCVPFNDCLANAACLACLTASGTNCDNNAPFQLFNTCEANNCNKDICGSGIYYENTQTKEPLFTCNNCIEQQCCGAMNPCIDPNNDGTITDPEKAACLDCLNEVDPLNPPSNSPCDLAGLTVQQGAVAFGQCEMTNCAGPCQF